MRVSADVGGTFTDLVVEYDRRRVPPVQGADDAGGSCRGILDAVDRAAAARRTPVAVSSAAPTCSSTATTRATNAILTGSTARTALLTTEGHPDILVFREGGRTEPFNFTVPYPSPTSRER